MRPDESGAVTAEAAVVIPLLALVALALAWLVTLGVADVRATDAARETARALARGDGATQSQALGERVAPSGARFEIAGEGGTVTVRVTVPVESPLAFLDFLPTRHVTAEAVALMEAP